MDRCLGLRVTGRLTGETHDTRVQNSADNPEISGESIHIRFFNRVAFAAVKSYPWPYAAIRRSDDTYLRCPKPNQCDASCRYKCVLPLRPVVHFSCLRRNAHGLSHSQWLFPTPSAGFGANMKRMGVKPITPPVRAMAQWFHHRGCVICRLNSRDCPGGHRTPMALVIV